MQKTLTKEQTGELYLFGQNLLWALFPVITILSVKTLPAMLTAGLSSLIAVAFFAFVLLTKKQTHELKIKQAWFPILMVTLINAIAFYALVFYGLQFTTSGNASIMLLMEVFFSITVLSLIKHESLNKTQILGSIIMVIGALFVLFPGTLTVNKGDLIILIATAIPPMGNYYTQKARKFVSSSTILFIRSFIAGLVLIFISLQIEPQVSISQISSSLIPLLINGFLIFGLSKILWIEAIHRISICKAISLTALNPLITMLFAYLLLNDLPTTWQILGFIPCSLGLYLLSDFIPKKSKHEKIPSS